MVVKHAVTRLKPAGKTGRQGLIHDVPTGKELIERIVGEAGAIVKERLGAMLA